MASFQAKIGWKTQRKRENKNCHSVPTLRVTENSKEIAKNFKNAIMSSFQAKIDLKMPGKERI